MDATGNYRRLRQINCDTHGTMMSCNCEDWFDYEAFIKDQNEKLEAHRVLKHELEDKIRHLERLLPICDSHKKQITTLTEKTKNQKATIARLQPERYKLKKAVADMADWFQTESDDTEHDCGNFDGGSTATCYACQLKETATHLYDLTK